MSGHRIVWVMGPVLHKVAPADYLVTPALQGDQNRNLLMLSIISLESGRERSELFKCLYYILMKERYHSSVFLLAQSTLAALHKSLDASQINVGGKSMGFLISHLQHRTMDKTRT